MFLKIMGAMPGYIYAQDESGVYVNLFVGSQAKLTVNGNGVTVRQTTKYPWEGAVRVAVQPSTPTNFALYVRVPTWCRPPVVDDLYQTTTPPAADAFVVSINGQTVKPLSIERGYVKLAREWRSGDYVDITMAMPARRIKARPEVADCAGCVALMYCVDSVDGEPTAGCVYLPPDAAIAPVYRNDILGGVCVLQGGFQARFEPPSKEHTATVLAVPYYAYGNRGPSSLRVWIPEDRAKASPNTPGKPAVP